MNTSYLTPDEAREVFNQWIKEESRNYVDKDNARFQVKTDELAGGRRIIRGLIL